MPFRNNEDSKLDVGESCRHCCIKIEGLTVRMGKNIILEGLDLHVHCGDVLAIIGPNGAGKTTLLRAILGEVPYQGRMVSLIGGVERRRPRIGYVPQKLQFDEDSPISVLDLVVAAISHRPVWMGISRKLCLKAEEVLRVFSADHLIHRRVGELSGGEIQRVLLAIAMTDHPELLLLDEPSAGVDVKGLALFYQLVRDLKKQHDISVILVTHDLSGISPYVDRLVLLNRSIVVTGTPDEVLSDEKLLHAFGPSLWNVTSMPFLPSKKEGA
ncbi:MAG: metal ABC transporter ATP-binding protein [Candidatus Omnitrophica bacterium]|nr:metal ABC transporter ATP-binding protein [Candidatus Omnitrophota bacterium]